MTCLDARWDPAKHAGFSEGDVQVVRNPRGRASGEAIRSVVIDNKFLGAGEWFVIHQTDCGMEIFTNDIDMMSDEPGNNLDRTAVRWTLRPLADDQRPAPRGAV